MKKYFLLMGFVLTIPAVIAADKPEAKSEEELSTLSSTTSPPTLQNSLGSDSSTPVPTTLPREVTIPVPTGYLPEALSSEDEFAALKRDQNNFEDKGGIVFGLLSESVLKEEAVQQQIKNLTELYNLSRAYNATLIHQLELANEYLKGMPALHRALESAQQERDKEARERELLESSFTALESELMAVKARASFLKSKEEKLLLEADHKDAAIIMEKTRKEFLERENLSLKEIIAELTANAKNVEALLTENSDYGKILQTTLGEGTDVEKTRQSIQVVVEANEKRIRELQEKNRLLAVQERETKDKISKLEKVIAANDHYSLVLNKINDRRVSDEDLALYIWSIRTVLDVDLDQLSQGHNKRLIEALINVSRPYKPRPDRSDACTYDGCFRTLGNQFTPRGLGWIGDNLNLRECTYVGSKFAQNSTDVARYAKEQLNQK